MTGEHSINGFFAVIPIAAWVVSAQGFFTATTAFLATCWYVRLFYLAWKADRVGPKGDTGETGARGPTGKTGRTGRDGHDA